MKILIDDADDDDNDFESILSPLNIEGYDWDLRKSPFINLLLVESQTKKGFTWKIVEGATGTGTRLSHALECSRFLIEDESEWPEDRIKKLKKKVLPTLEDRGAPCTRAFKNQWWQEFMEIK